MLEKLEKYCISKGINLNEKQFVQLSKYCELLQKTNEQINLIADSSDKYLFGVHLNDCLQIKNLKKIDIKTNWIDVGSGGGLPGLVAAILYPGVKFSLVESVRKKYSFLVYASVHCEIGNTEIFNQRAEEFVNQKEIKKTFSVFTARGVGKMEYLEHMFKNALSGDGVMILWKNPNEVTEYLKKNKEWSLIEHLSYLSGEHDKHIILIQRNKVRGKKGSYVSKNKKFCTRRA
ncbi:MAG: 16S rRNA (guanine(527)-N(7))-methyltransferase RsmG [Caldisericia bacterium]|nr:16S rRNA (guanine(527)-N(7))-methyltransferase RsmG [Caldisericia bacterium]